MQGKVEQLNQWFVVRKRAEILGVVRPYHRDFFTLVPSPHSSGCCTIHSWTVACA